MRARRRLGIWVLAFGPTFFGPGVARAQVHWDAGAAVGVMERVTTGGASNAKHPTPGPTGELNAHVAVLPMLRIGPYLAHDISPSPDAPAREMTEVGLRAKLTPPLLSAPWQSWAMLGAGYLRAYEPSHETTIAPGIFVPGRGGGVMDLRLGLGLGYRLNRSWELFAELGSRFGVAFTGSLYDPSACTACEPYVGKDSFALSLTMGLSLRQ